MSKPEWYRKARGRGDTDTTGGIIPLDRESCGRPSIYAVGLDGSLWTLQSSGDEIYKQVRDDIGLKDLTGYLCAHCGAFEPSFEDMEAAHVFGSSVGITLEVK